MDISQILSVPVSKASGVSDAASQESPDWMATLNLSDPEASDLVEELAQSVEPEVAMDGDEVEPAEIDTLVQAETPEVNLEHSQTDTEIFKARDPENKEEAPSPIQPLGLDAGSEMTALPASAMAQTGVQVSVTGPAKDQFLPPNKKVESKVEKTSDVSVARTIIDAASADSQSVKETKSLKQTLSGMLSNTTANADQEIRLGQPDLTPRDVSKLQENNVEKSGKAVEKSSAIPYASTATSTAMNALMVTEEPTLLKNADAELGMNIKDRMGVSSTASMTTATNISATIEAKPRAVVYQISQAISESGSNDIELRLDPAELGKVRISMAFRDGQMIATIVAERPETLDLLRRNADDLRSELSNQGLENASLDFGQNQQSDDANTSNSSAFNEREQEVISVVEPVLLKPETTSSGLDVRL